MITDLSSRPPRIVTTYPVDWPNCHVVDRRTQNRRAWMPELVNRARSADLLLLNGGVPFQFLYDELVLAATAVRLNRRLRVVLAECWWEPGSRRLNRLLKIESPPAADAPPKYAFAPVIRTVLTSFAHPRIHHCVCASAERAVFAERWSIPIHRVHFIPYHANRVAASGTARSAVDVFAGGDTLRDYRPLLASAPEVSGRIRIATRLKAPASVPGNVAYGAVDRSDYDRLAGGARVVAVALRRDAPRSAGHQTYLDAMLAGIPVVVMRSLGVDDYIEDGVTGRIVEPTAPSLSGAINEALAGGSTVAAMVDRAQAKARSCYLLEHYFARLYSLCVKVSSV
jgi:hypothetical protein